MGHSQESSKYSSGLPGWSPTASQLRSRPSHEADASAQPQSATSQSAPSQFESRPFGPAVAPAIQAKEEQAAEQPRFDLSKIDLFAGGSAPPPSGLGSGSSRGGLPSMQAKPMLQRQAEPEGPEEDEQTTGESIQRKCETCGGDDDEGDAASGDAPGGIQTKLTIGQPGDKYEQEADRMAAQVVSMPEPVVQRQADPSETGFLGETRFLSPSIQAKGGEGQASADFEQRLGVTKGSGAPLGDDVRGFMEPRFGADFSQVRVHTGSEAVQLNKEVGAQAFTHGNDLYFNAGKYSPDSTAGKELLAHELTHTIQQTGAQHLRLQRQQDDSPGKARRHALKIKEALLDGWTEDEQLALNQIRKQSVLMLREIRAQYRIVTGGHSLEADFKKYCSSSEYKEALALLYSTLSIEDRIRTNINKGWLFNTENEAGMLEVLRQASRPELSQAAKSKSLMKLLRDSLNDDEYYEARKLLTPTSLYDVVVERIKNAHGWVNDDEDATYNALLDLTPAQRRRLWTENDPDTTESTLFNFMSSSERASVRVMCLGSEAQALKERMEIATTGLGTDNDAVKLVIKKTKTAAQQERVLSQMLKVGKDARGRSLTTQQLARLQTQLDSLGGIQKNLLTAERNKKDGGLKSGSFLEMLHGDVSGAEFQAFSAQIGVSQYERAKQQILDAVGFFNDDEEAIYKAFDKAIAAIELPPSTKFSRLTPERRARLQQEANHKLRQKLLNDPQIKLALGNLSGSELSKAKTYASADNYKIAIDKLQEAYYGIDTDEEEIFRIVCAMSATDRKRLQQERPKVYQRMLNPTKSSLTQQERQMLTSAVRTGKISTEKALDWAFGGQWDGTAEEMLAQTFAAMNSAERYQYRLGYYLFKGGNSFSKNEAGKRVEKAAETKFKQLYARMTSELGTDDLQKALDQLLGTPTLQELKSEQGRMMAVQIMRNRIADKGDIREGDTVSSSIVDTFSDNGKVSDQAEVQFESAYKLAMADKKLTAAEFTALAALDANFAKKYREYVATVDQITNIASTVAAIAVGIAAVVLSGGTGAPAVATLLGKFGITATTAQSVTTAAAIAGTSSAVAKVGVSEIVGGSHYDSASTEGLQSAAVGFTEGAMAIVAMGLANRFSNLVGLGKTKLAGEMTATILASSEAATNQAGKAFARAGLEGLIEGFLSGAMGELVMTATDKAVWQKSIWDVVLSFGRAVLKGGGIGAVTGGITGGGLETLTTYVGVKRLQSLMRQLDTIGINEEQLSNMSIDALKNLGKADVALASGKFAEAETALKTLEAFMQVDDFNRLKKLLLSHHRHYITKLNPKGLKKDIQAQKDLFSKAQDLRKRQQELANKLLDDQNIKGGTAISILKRDDFDGFIKGVLEKCDRKGYESVAQMDDMVRGRFDLPDEEGVAKIVAALKKQTQYDIVSAEFPRRIVKIGDGNYGYGYPRHHIILKDPKTGLTHEWQIGTKAVSDLYETPGILIPDALKPRFRLKPDLHDIEYDIFKSVHDKHPKLAAKLDIPAFRERVNQASAKAGQGKIQDVKALHMEASRILQNLVDAKGPAFVEQFYH